MRFAVAIVVSFAVHFLIGLALWFYLEHAPAPDVFVTLDLSSVELSFAEKEDDTASVLPQLPSPAVLRPKISKPTVPVDAFPRNASKPLPDIPDAVDIPRPIERPQLSAPAPRQAKVDAPPRPKRTIKPDYPKGSRQRGEQGDVVVEMSVNAQGGVESAAVVASSGFPELDEAALRAVRSAKFTPAKSGGDSIASTARLTLTFKLK